MTEENQKPIFPLKVTQCPNCESERTLANEVLKVEKEQGKVGKDFVAYITAQQSAIMDITKTVLSAPVIFTYFDVCADCGTVYCVYAELKITVPGISNKKQPQPPFDPTRKN